MTPLCSERDLLETSRAFRIQRGVATSVLPVKRLNDGATIPTYGSSGAAGLDLSANFHGENYNAVAIHPGERRLIKTGLSIAVPAGHYGRIAPRSGIANKHGIDVLAGVVDDDYRGDVGVILINLGFKFDEEGQLVDSGPFIVAHGDRIAQLIIEQFTPCLVVPCSEIEDSLRGVGGFGSTGT